MDTEGSMDKGRRVAALVVQEEVEVVGKAVWEVVVVMEAEMEGMEVVEEAMEKAGN